MRDRFLRIREDGFTLLEVMASLAILVMAAAILASGLLLASRLMLEARKLEKSSSLLAASVERGEEPNGTEEIILSFTIDGRRVELGARALRYEKEESLFWRLSPLEDRHDENMEDMQGR